MTTEAQHRGILGGDRIVLCLDYGIGYTTVGISVEPCRSLYQKAYILLHVNNTPIKKRIKKKRKMGRMKKMLKIVVEDV